MSAAKRRWVLVGMILTACGLFAVAIGQVAAPQQPAAVLPTAMRAATCDIGEVFQNYQRSRDLNDELKKRQQEIRTESERRAKAVQDMARELQELKPDSPQFEARLGEMERLQVESKTWLELQEAQIRRWHVRMMKEVYDDVVRAVEQVARDKGLHMVLYQEHQEIGGGDLNQIARRQVIYSDPAMDVTAAVLQRLQETYSGRRRPS